MATIYVRNAATGAADGTSWTDAYVTIKTAVANWTIADKIWVAADHAESYSANHSITCPVDTLQLNVPIYRMDHTTNVYSPTPQDGTGIAQITITGSSKFLGLEFNGALYGLKFVISDNLYFGVATGAPDLFTMEDCDITIGSVTANADIIIQSPMYVIVKNTYFRSPTTGCGLLVYNTRATFWNCTFDLASEAGGFVRPSSTTDLDLTFNDCDFSLLTNPILVNTTYATSITATQYVNRPQILFNSCKLREDYTMGDGLLFGTLLLIKLNACSTATKAYCINSRATYEGLVTTSTTVYHNTGYAEGPDRMSISLAPDTGCIPNQTIETPKMGGVLETTGIKTFTIQGIENYTTPLTKQDLWLELVYFNDANDTRHALDTSSREFIKPTYTELTAGTGVGNWTGEPTGSRSFKIELTVTVAKKGLYSGIIHIGKYEAGKVVHIDPMFVVT